MAQRARQMLLLDDVVAESKQIAQDAKNKDSEEEEEEEGETAGDKKKEEETKKKYKRLSARDKVLQLGSKDAIQTAYDKDQLLDDEGTEAMRILQRLQALRDKTRQKIIAMIDDALSRA